MIAAMKRVHIVLLDGERSEALRALRRLGVVHLERLDGQGPEREDSARRLTEVERALGALSSVKGVKATRPPDDEPDPSARRGGLLASRHTPACPARCSRIVR